MACTAAHAFSRLPDFVSLRVQREEVPGEQVQRFEIGVLLGLLGGREELAGELRQAGDDEELAPPAGATGPAAGFAASVLEARDRDLGQRAAGDRLAEDAGERREVVLCRVPPVRGR